MFKCGTTIFVRSFVRLQVKIRQLFLGTGKNVFNKLLTYLKIHEKLSDWNNTTIASILSLLIFVKNKNAHCTHSYTMLYAVHLQAIAMQNLIL